MRKAKFKKQLTIAISQDDFERIKQITDAHEISLAEWFRDAVAAALNNAKRGEGLMND
jgi:hypothetical protein